MFNTVEIKNFQSHKDSKLVFSPGINLFTGNSDCGKSAIMRALLWNITNKPSGDSFVSNTIKDNKGKIKGETSVVLDGVARIKSKDFNGYKFNSETFEALRTDVPAVIADELNIKDVNIQRQLDGPFMLSNTPGENAKYINELVNLEVIDNASYWVASKIRDAKTDEKYAVQAQEELEKKLIDEDQITELKSLANALSSYELEISSKTLGIQNTSEAVESYEKIKNSVPDSQKVSELVTMLSSIERLNGFIQDTWKEIQNIQESLNNHILASHKIPDSGKVAELASNLSKIVEFNDSISFESANLENLYKSVNNHDFASKKIPDIVKVDELAKNIDSLAKFETMIPTIQYQVGDLESSISKVLEYQGKLMHIKPALESVTEQLSTMVCPLCGRGGCNC